MTSLGYIDNALSNPKKLSLYGKLFYVGEIMMPAMLLTLALIMSPNRFSLEDKFIASYAIYYSVFGSIFAYRGGVLSKPLDKVAALLMATSLGFTGVLYFFCKGWINDCPLVGIFMILPLGLVTLSAVYYAFRFFKPDSQTSRWHIFGLIVRSGLFLYITGSVWYFLFRLCVMELFLD